MFSSLQDVTPYMNPAPFTVSPNTHVSQVFNLFRTMGLRHLPVVNAVGEVSLTSHCARSHACLPERTLPPLRVSQGFPTSRVSRTKSFSAPSASCVSDVHSPLGRQVSPGSQLLRKSVGQASPVFLSFTLHQACASWRRGPLPTHAGHL